MQSANFSKDNSLLKTRLAEEDANRKYSILQDELVKTQQDLYENKDRLKRHTETNKITEQALNSRIRDLEEEVVRKDKLKDAEKDKADSCMK